MKRLLMFILALAVMSAGACSSKNEVLALYDAGVITGNDLSLWLEDMGIPCDKIFDKDKKSKQRVYLRQIALERLQIDAIKKAGYDTRPEYIERMVSAEESFLAAYYRQKLHQRIEFSEDAVKVSIIRLKIKPDKDSGTPAKNSNPDYKKSLQRTVDSALSIIKQINSGARFDDMAEKYSEDFSAKEGGDIGYIVEDMREKDFFEAALRLKEGEVTLEPVVISGSVYIIRADDRVVLTEGTIKKIIDDEERAGRITRRIKMNAVRKIEERLAEQPDVVNNIETGTYAVKGALLFRIGEYSFTMGDLDRVMETGKSSRRGMGLPEKAPDQRRKHQIADKIFRDKLLEREARSLKMDQDEKYIRQWQHIKNSTLISFYRDEVILKIEHITRSRRAEMIRSWEQHLLDESHYRVN